MTEPGTTAWGDEPPEEEVVLDPLLLQARRGLALHSTVTGVVCVLLIALNVARAPELIWWPFPLSACCWGWASTGGTGTTGSRSSCVTGKMAKAPDQGLPGGGRPGRRAGQCAPA